MRVGLDAIPLAAPRTGVGHYTFELARHLALLAPADEFELVSPFPYAAPLRPDAELPANLRVTQAQVNVLWRRWFAVGLPLYARQAAFDLFHGTNYEVPLWGGRPTVLTIHDLSLLLHPETHEAHLARRGRRRLPLMARTASAIITPTESIRREVCEHLGVAPAKVLAIPEAPRAIFRPLPSQLSVETRRRLKIEDEFVLFVGTIEPRKNLKTLLAAFAEVLRATDRRPQLVLAGQQGWLMDDLDCAVERAGLGDRLRLTGYVSDEDLCALYSSCRVMVYPSLYEGFGLPPLEAMACGAPVVASRIPSLLETIGAEAARLVAPLEVQALGSAITGLLANESERRALSLAGRERAAQFSWQRTARLTLEVYEAALEL